MILADHHPDAEWAHQVVDMVKFSVDKAVRQFAGTTAPQRQTNYTHPARTKEEIIATLTPQERLEVFGTPTGQATTPAPSPEAKSSELEDWAL